MLAGTRACSSQFRMLFSLQQHITLSIRDWREEIPFIKNCGLTLIIRKTRFEVDKVKK